MPCAFDCTDCGDHVVEIVNDKPPYGALCATCLHVPGWYRDPSLVGLYDPNRPIPPLDRKG